ncbi:MAG: hypothetical protein J0I50_01665 [Microbacterium sp.]|nr:hypothetical protein [Microbacterium sp.]
MHRLLVALLAALDAVIAAAVGVAAALVPLTLLWVFGLGTPVWAALWPASAAVWQAGHLVPHAISLPAAYLASAGVPADAASFTLSLAPLAYASFTAVFAARSGRRAARAGAWVTGVVSGGVVFAVLCAIVWLTSRTAIAAVHGWQAVLLPTLVFLVPALAGAVSAAWSDGDDGVVDRLHDRIDRLPGAWRALPALALRGAAIVLVGLLGLGAAALVLALLVRGGEVIALYEAGNMNAVGVVLVSLGQIAYLPTLVIWAMSFVAGPGFAVGAGTAVSPSGTQLGVVPGIPILGALPESTPSWLLVVVILPIAVAAFAGWALRSRLAASGDQDAVGARLALTGAVAVLSALGTALLAVLASGSIGPDRLAQTGPAPGPVALAVGVEALVGAGILLISPRRQDDLPTAAADVPAPVATVENPLPVWPPIGRSSFADDLEGAATRTPRRAGRGRAADEDGRETAPIEADLVGGLLGADAVGRPYPPGSPIADETETAPIEPGPMSGGAGQDRTADPDADGDADGRR